MKRLEPDECGFNVALNVIGGKWKTAILCELNVQGRRFGELRRLVPGISEKVLMQQLREMEADGIVHREVFPEVPPRVEYSVTEFGTTLNDAIVAVAEWGRRYENHQAALRGQPVRDTAAGADSQACIGRFAGSGKRHPAPAGEPLHTGP